jgi:L-amino acid N-acyltransferase YncA
MRVRLGGIEDESGALSVWWCANVSRGMPPVAARIERIQAKLCEADALLVVVEADSGDLIGMALAEPGRDRDSGGQPAVGLCHVSMVFVAPEWWGRKVGTAILRGLMTEAVARGYDRLQAWTRATNVRARRLYERVGFVASGRRSLLGDEVVIHYIAELGPDQPMAYAQPWRAYSAGAADRGPRM